MERDVKSLPLHLCALSKGDTRRHEAGSGSGDGAAHHKNRSQRLLSSVGLDKFPVRVRRAAPSGWNGVPKRQSISPESGAMIRIFFSCPIITYLARPLSRKQNQKQEEVPTQTEWLEKPQWDCAPK